MNFVSFSLEIHVQGTYNENCHGDSQNSSSQHVRPVMFVVRDAGQSSKPGKSY